MPRDSSGNYTLTSGQPVVTGTTISSSTFNTLTSDLATELTNSLDRQGRGAMTARLQLYDGNAPAPGLCFGTDTGSGLYRAGAHDIRLSMAGSDVLAATASGVSVTGTTTSSGALTVSSGGASITGTTTVAGATSVTGNDITIDSGKSFKYASTVTHKVHVAGSAFVFEYNASGGVRYSAGRIQNSDSNTITVAAQFFLPPGAIITGIDVNVHNSDAVTRTLQVAAYKQTASSSNFNSPTYYTTGSGSGASVAVGATTTNWFSVGLVGGVASIDDASADGQNLIEIVFPATTGASSLTLYSVRFTYTITSEKPAV